MESIYIYILFSDLPAGRKTQMRRAKHSGNGLAGDEE